MRIEANQQSVKSVSRSLAAEDIAAGDYIVITSKATEFPSWMWEDYHALPPDQPVRIWWQSYSSLVPWKVVDVCLPMLLVRGVDRTVTQLDVRLLRIARVDRGYARKVRKSLRKNQKQPVSR
ncbi:MAG: hypothetical protein ABL921_23835 [Pirellula sp.]